MTATNHVLTGSAFVATTVGHVPLWVSFPAAFLLHFVLDALPHFGQRDDAVKSLTRLKWILPTDATVAATVLLTIFIPRREHWLPILVGGILCASPDLWSIARFRRFLKTGDASYSKDWFARFHHWLQWGERPWGIWIELGWALSLGSLLFIHL